MNTDYERNELIGNQLPHTCDFSRKLGSLP